MFFAASRLVQPRSSDSAESIAPYLRWRELLGLVVGVRVRPTFFITTAHFAEIPAGTKKCCQACFQRISRKIGQMSSGANSPASSSAADGAASAAGGKGANSGQTDGADAKGDKGGQKAAWADGEVEAMKAELRAHGRNWAALAGKISTKTAEQCKKFFYENRKKCGLDKIILEYKRVSAPLRLKFWTAT